MKSISSYILALCLALHLSCGEENIKETINKTGAVAGEAIGELSTGIKSGVEKAIAPTIISDSNFVAKGIELGKFTIESDSGNNDNKLVIYFIFTKDFNGSVQARAYDQDKEMGRAVLKLKGQANEGKFVEFKFDPRTDIGNDSKIILF